MSAPSFLTRSLIAAGVAWLGTSAAHAYKFNALDQLQNQGEFKQLAQDLSSTLAYKPYSPAESLGLIGFDLGVSAAATSIKSQAVVERATGSDNVPSALPTVTLHAEKGLPFGVDLGVNYTVIPGTSASAVSGAVKWAVVQGGALTPAVAVRAFYTQANGLGEMNLRSQGVDLSISKGFAIVTPYVGVGVVRSRASTDSGRWAREAYNQTRLFAGANLNLVVMDLAIEADRTGDASTVGLKAGFRF